jgi:hypothetical protein
LVTTVVVIYDSGSCWCDAEGIHPGDVAFSVAARTSLRSSSTVCSGTRGNARRSSSIPTVASAAAAPPYKQVAKRAAVVGGRNFSSVRVRTAADVPAASRSNLG